MAREQHRSIRSQLFLMAFGLLIILAAVTFFMAKGYGQRAAKISFDRLLAGAAHQIAEGITMNEGIVQVDLPVSAFETLSLAENDRVFYQIRSLDSEHLTGYRDLPIDSGAEAQLLERVQQQTPEPVYFSADYSGEPVRFLLFSKVLTETHYFDIITIQIGQTTQARQDLAEEISLRAIQLIMPFFFIALVLVMLGIWQLMKPIRRLNIALANRNAADLSPLQLPVPSEVDPLVTTINRFMNQLDSTLNRLKQFTSEAAHQIRTPLAGLKSQAQNALEEEDPELRQEQLKRVVESCDLLNDTVSQLLDQAVLAHRFQSEPLTDTRLDLVTKQVCRDVAVAALQQGVEIAYSGEIEVTVLGDEFALKQMLRNILENAIKYSPQDGLVEVVLQQHTSDLLEQIVLEVKDQGIGIPDSEKPQVFERFYRSPNNPRKGTGLGLAIAKEVAVHHKAYLKLLDNQPQGLVVQITFNHYLD